MASTKLSLDEIGTLFVLMSLVGNEDNGFASWKNDEKFRNHVRRLIDRGVVKVFPQEDNTLEMEIDLTSL